MHALCSNYNTLKPERDLRRRKSSLYTKVYSQVAKKTKENKNQTETRLTGKHPCYPDQCKIPGDLRQEQRANHSIPGNLYTNPPTSKQSLEI